MHGEMAPMADRRGLGVEGGRSLRMCERLVCVKCYDKLQQVATNVCVSFCERLVWVVNDR